MSNVHNFAKTLLLASLLVCVAACSDNHAREAAATALVSDARAQVEAQNYDSAMVLLDTLDVKYRDCIAQRKEGTVVRLTALGALTRDSLVSAEMQMRANKEVLDELTPQFKKIDIAGTEGYFVDKETYTGKEMNTTGLQARVDDEGYLFIVVNLSGRRIGMNALSYDGVTTPTAESVAIEGSEIMSLSQEKTVELLDRVLASPAPVMITIVGSKGNATVTLNAAQLTSLATTRRYAGALQTNRRLSINLEKLERQLAKVSDNLANQIPTIEADDQP